MNHPSWDVAIDIAARSGRSAPMPTEVLALDACLGRTLTEDLRADADIPHFDSSAMDGFAIAGPPPWVLEGSAAATDASGTDPGTSGAAASSSPHAASGAAALPAGHARAILTGGAVPEGATGVLRSEHAAVGEGTLDLAAGAPETDLAAGRNIRRAGRETRAGELLIPAGTVLSPAHLAYAAVAGIDGIPVAARPRVALILTGDEVITAGQPAPGQVRDTFGPVLPGIVGMLGGQVVSSVRIGDDAAATRQALQAAAAGAEVVLTTGGTGHSSADHVRREAEALAGGFVFAELAMRPGHPTTLARFGASGSEVSAAGRGDDERSVWHVGLPGNPLAAMTALRVVVEPLMAGLLGRPVRRAQWARTDVPIEPTRMTTLMPSRQVATGVWEPCLARGANMLRGLAAADGLLIVPTEGIAAGGDALVLDLPWSRAGG